MFKIIKKSTYNKLQSRIIELETFNRENIKWKNYYKDRYEKLKNTKEDFRNDYLSLLKKKLIRLKNNGFTYKEIAKQCNINPSYISQIMIGKYKPRFNVIDNIVCEINKIRK